MATVANSITDSISVVNRGSPLSGDNDRSKQNRDTISELQAELAELRETSRELESEMELELEDSYKRMKQLETQVSNLTNDRDTWKQKYMDLQKEYNNSHLSLTKRISTLEKSHKEANSRLREIEMENDDMERSERITKSTLEDLENKYHDCLEEIAMLEADVAGKQDLVIELQRTKDELRDTKEELAVSKTRTATVDGNVKANTNVSSNANRVETQTKSSPISSLDSQNSIDMNQWPPYAGSAPRRLASSRSLRKIHGMLDQMKLLEGRVAAFKSTLPAVRTPTKGSPVSLKRSPSSPASSSPLFYSSKSTGSVGPSYSSSKLPTAIDTTDANRKHSPHHLAPSDSSLASSEPSGSGSASSHASSKNNRLIGAVDSYSQNKAQLYTLGHRHYGSLRNNSIAHGSMRASVHLTTIEGSPNSTDAKGLPIGSSPRASPNTPTIQRSKKHIPLRTQDTNERPQSQSSERPGSSFSALHSRFGSLGRK